MPPKKRRPSVQTVMVVQVMAEAAGHSTYGLEIGRLTGLASGTIGPILARLEKEGLITSTWEDIDPRTVGRPRRRIVTLTPAGARFADGLLDSLSAGQDQPVPAGKES